MKNFPAPFLALAVALLSLTLPVHAIDHVQMQQAMDLVDKAWNPGGKPPAKEKRIAMINKAIKLLEEDPFNGYAGHKTQAIRYMQAAIEQIKMGDPNNKVFNYLQDAEHQMRDALADAE